MANPGVAGSQIPAGEDWLVRKVADLERAVRELGPSIAKSFAPVIADLQAKQATLDAQQVTLTAAVADIAANLASINDLLTKVVTPQIVSFSAANFALATTSAFAATLTVTVPAGFTKAAIYVTSRAIAFNPNTTGGLDGLGADYMNCASKIDTVRGTAIDLRTAGGSISPCSVDPYAQVLTGLTGGGTFVLGVLVQSNIAGWAANAANFAEMNGLINWYQ